MDVYANQQRRNMGCGRCPGLAEADVSDGLPDSIRTAGFRGKGVPRIGSGQPLRIRDFVSRLKDNCQPVSGRHTQGRYCL